jgi:exopolysaccharide biosynthesis polyprenyl glycosylphosphotransferase
VGKSVIEAGESAALEFPASSRGAGPAARPRPTAREMRLQFMADAAMLLAACLALLLSAATGGPRTLGLGWALLFVAVTLLALRSGGAYQPRFGSHFLDELRLIFGATAVAAMLVTFGCELFSAQGGSAPQTIRAWVFAAIYLAAGRGGQALALGRSRRQAQSGGATLIVGAGKVGSLVAERLLAKPEFGLRPVAFLDENPLPGRRPAGLPVYRIGDVDLDGEGADGDLVSDVQQLVDEHVIEHVIVAFSQTSHTEELELMRRCEDLGVSVSIIPRLFERVPDRTRVERLGGIPLVTVHPSYPKGWQFAAKYVFDRALALLALIVLAPLLLVIAIAVLLSLRWPILFRQPRVGVDGQCFQLLKFRTMRPAPERTGPDAGLVAARTAPGGVAGEEEDRRTRLGKVLRATSLDELPQLINVLRGDMSLVGPRPEQEQYVRVFEREIYRYAERHRVKSGITGWAQIHRLRGNTSIEDRVEWDNYYIENWSPWLDLKILLMTPLVALRDRAE